MTNPQDPHMTNHQNPQDYSPSTPPALPESIQSDTEAFQTALANLSSVPPATLAPSSAAPLIAPAEEEQCLLSFFTVEGISRALATTQLTVEEEFRILAEIARDPINPIVRMTALDKIRTRLRDALLLSGQFQRCVATQTRTNPDGSALQAKLVTTRLLGHAAETERLLAAGSRVSEILDLNTQPNPDDLPALDSPVPPLQENSNAPGTSEVPPTRPDPEERLPGPRPFHPSADPGALTFKRRPRPRPNRDLGGGGLAQSSRQAADAARISAARTATSQSSARQDPPAGCPGQDGLPDVPSDPELQQHHPLE